jgi:Tol biopolymer transport system component
MTGRSGFDRRIFDFLDREVGRGSPDYLDDILSRTATTRQRPAWTSIERWLPVDLTSGTSTLAPPRLGRALLIVILVAALVGVAVFVGTRRERLPAPFGVAANGVIVYSADGDIRAADPDGSDPRALVSGPEDDVGPLLSSDGTRFSFFRAVSTFGFDVIAASAAGTDLQVLTPQPIASPSWADWSPNGSELLVLHAVRLMEPAISIVATDGSRQMRTLPLGDLVPDSPTWRPPDGREIVFRGVMDGRVALYRIGADGEGLQPVTPVVPDESAYRGPRFSPDGSRVTYDRCLPAATPDGRCEVHVLDLTTDVDVRVGYDPTARHELQPKFSPDGRSVLFVRFPGDGDASLVIAAADGRDVGRQVGPAQGWADAVFEFSPDGRKILVSLGMDRLLQIIDIASGTVETGEFAVYPTWQRRAP